MSIKEKEHRILEMGGLSGDLMRAFRLARDSELAMLERRRISHPREKEKIHKAIYCCKRHYSYLLNKILENI